MLCTSFGHAASLVGARAAAVEIRDLPRQRSRLSGLPELE